MNPIRNYVILVVAILVVIAAVVFSSRSHSTKTTTFALTPYTDKASGISFGYPRSIFATSTKDNFGVIEFMSRGMSVHPPSLSFGILSKAASSTAELFAYYTEGELKAIRESGMVNESKTETIGAIKGNYISGQLGEALIYSFVSADKDRGVVLSIELIAPFDYVATVSTSTIEKMFRDVVGSVR